MYYRLTEDYAIRSFWPGDHYLYIRNRPKPGKMDERNFELLSRCDGLHDLEESSMLKLVLGEGVIEPCEKGRVWSDWSAHRYHDHRYVPSMNLMITGKCNYNCLHCFNAADNATLMEEWDFEDLKDLLDQASECGIHSVTLTGGEPMLHPRFADIVKEIRKRNMVLEKLTTNGFYLYEDTLKLFDELGFSPQIKISFDGIGHHDHMRGHKGAEDDAIRAFRLCRENGFHTLAQTQVHRGNIACMKETIGFIEELGAGGMRIIRTTATPRWAANAPDGTIPVEEYFEKMLELASWYLSGDHDMELVFWRFLNILPQKKYHMVLVPQRNGEFHPGVPLCLGNRMMIAITCEKDVVPCLQMSGLFRKFGISCDSLKERSLKDVITEGKWLDTVCRNRAWLRDNSKECGSCRWFGHCGGGCRGLGILEGYNTTGTYDYSKNDPMACMFYKNGWYDRVKKELKDYEEI